MKKNLYSPALYFLPTIYLSVHLSHNVCGGGMCVYLCIQSLGHVRLFVTSWIVARQAPLSMQLLRQKSGTESMSLASAGGFFTTEPPVKLLSSCRFRQIKIHHYILYTKMRPPPNQSTFKYSTLVFIIPIV